MEGHTSVSNFKIVKYTKFGLLAIVALFSVSFFLQNFSTLSTVSRASSTENTSFQEAIFSPAAKTDIMNEENSTAINGETTGTSWIGTGSTQHKSFLGIRLSGASIPPKSTILSARLQLVSSQDQWITVKTLIGAEKTINPATFTSDSKPSMRPLTTDRVLYAENIAWKKNNSYFVDVTKVIKEIYATDRPENSPIVLVFDGKAGRFARKYFFNTPNSTTAPRLIISYETKGQSGTIAPTSIPTANPSPTSRVAPSQTPSQAPSGMPPDHSMGGSGLSHAMGLWNPNPKYDTCSKEFHDSFNVTGPDGKKYPTWHPPTAVDPSTGKTCTFGHEHGRDPSGSALMSFIKEQYGGIPFGYANEKLDEYNQSKGITNGMRHEDHVGHKIEWENNVHMDKSGCNGGTCREALNLYCDFLMKVHQGTHSKDAFTNNLHELEYFVQCHGDGPMNGTKMAVAKMVIFGKPGSFFDGTVDQGGTEVFVGPASPANSPSSNTGARSIPAIGKVKQHILVPSGQFSLYSNGIYEDWISSNYILTPDNRQIAYFDPHFAVFQPSRFYWPGSDTSVQGVTRTAQDVTDNVGRSVDLCYMSENNGAEKARGGACDEMTNYGQIKERIAYDDPRSAFNGVHREFYFNQSSIANANGPVTWYSDPFGKNAQTTPFAGSIKQYIASMNNELGYPLESQAIGKDRYYGGNGVHAPN